MKGLLLFASLVIFTGLPGWAFAQKVSKDKEKTIYDIPVEPMRDDCAASKTLAPYKGKVLLIVNVASKCGFTAQYEGLEKLYQRYKDQDLVVLGFPSNDFGGQEPGSEQEIVQFCRANFGVSFPLYAKLHAIGEDKSPIYQYLTESELEDKGEVKWNFEKFLVGRNGRVVARFRSKATPDDPQLIKAIEKELACEPADHAAKVKPDDMVKNNK